MKSNANMNRKFPLQAAVFVVVVLFNLALVDCAFSLQDSTQETASRSNLHSTIGYPQQISQIVIPGSEIEAKPIIDRDQPVIIRILATFPHGTHFRYDMEYRVLDAGDFNLADYLRRKDSTDTQTIMEIPVHIESLLGEKQVEPTELTAKRSRFSSFYLPALVVGCALWLAGLAMILFYGRGKTKRPLAQEKFLTVADRLKPLVDAAIAGKIDSQQQAELERVLSSFWSKKLRLNHLPAAKLREHLRQHTEASQLLTQIDHWLHRPKNSNGAADVDVAKLLEPYQPLQQDEV